MTSDAMCIFIIGACIITKIICNTIIELKKNNTDEDDE